MRCKPTRRTHSKHTLGHLDGQGLGGGIRLGSMKMKAKWDKWKSIELKSLYTMKKVTKEWGNLQNRRKFLQTIHMTDYI